jgi:Tol biopolymer transport system component
MPASGGQATELFQVKFPEMIANLVWSNDSRSVLFVRGNLGGQQSRQGLRPLWQIPAAGGEPRQLGALVDEGQINILSLHPNGRRIAYTRSSREFEIWAMEGLLAAASPE